jgi:hypothetical protein
VTFPSYNFAIISFLRQGLSFFKGLRVDARHILKNVHLIQRLHYSLNKYPLGDALSLHGFKPQPIQKMRKKKAHSFLNPGGCSSLRICANVGLLCM